MTYNQFEAVWTELVTNHVPTHSKVFNNEPLSNGVSKELVDALIKAGEGDHSALEAAEKVSR